jgi:hypothetical protein
MGTVLLIVFDTFADLKEEFQKLGRDDDKRGKYSEHFTLSNSVSIFWYMNR